MVKQGWPANLRRMGDALAKVIVAAERAHEAGWYPSTELALFELAVNQRRATGLGVALAHVLHLYKESGRSAVTPQTDNEGQEAGRHEDA